MADTNGNEEWRPVVGYEGFYSVSNHGRVRRDAGGHGARCGRILRSCSARGCYRLVSLTLAKKGKTHSVHSLVLNAFIGPPQQSQECRHLDGNAANNNVENLKWGTSLENRDDMRSHGTLPVGSKHSSSKLTESEVEVILCLRKRGWTQQRIADSFCVNRGTINSIDRNKTWRHITR